MKKKRKKRSWAYRVSAWLHLWLGLVSGIIVVIVSLTGAILTFEREIKDTFYTYHSVEKSDKSLLPPSVLKAKVMEKYGFPNVNAIVYREEGRSTEIPYYGDRTKFQIVYVNPYTGEILKNEILNKEFFRIMLEGHYGLWLPRNIGQPLVSYGTLVFVITLITGLVLWWPKKWTKSTRERSFLIKFKGTWKRINYDLHNALGFYSLLIALILGLTGMVYGMQWFSKSVYFIASGGQTKQTTRVDNSLAEKTKSSTVPNKNQTAQPIQIPGKAEEDILFEWINKQTDLRTQQLTIGFPIREGGAWNFSLNPDPITRYQTRNFSFEKKTLKPLKQDRPMRELNGGELAEKFNYDLHVGAIGGLWTKFIAFLVCLVCASLPITGFIIWYNKKWGKNKKSTRSKRKSTYSKRKLPVISESN